MALVDYQTLVESLVRDLGEEAALTDFAQAIDLAAIRYSTDRPQTAVEDVAAAGGNMVDLPPGWQADFSAVVNLEIPPGQVPPAYVHQDDWTLYQVLAGYQVMLAWPLTAGDTVRFHYTIAHTLDETADTIPARDREAVANWAAALLLDQLATVYAGHRQSTIDADSVDWQNKSRDFAGRAKASRQLYWNHLGIDPKRNAAAGAVVDLDMRDSRGKDRLFHRARRR